MPPPVIIIPDTAPLIHLAAGELLHLLTDMGRGKRCVGDIWRLVTRV